MFYAAFALLLVIIFGNTGHDTEKLLTCIIGVLLFVGFMRLGRE